MLVPVDEYAVWQLNEAADCDEFMPGWLSMVKGVVDPADLLLHIPLETLNKTHCLSKQNSKQGLEMVSGIVATKED